MGEIVNLNKKGGEGEYKVPEFRDADWTDDIDVPKRKGKAERFEFFEDEADYRSHDVVSGEAENEIADFWQARMGVESLRSWLKKKNESQKSLRKAA